VKGRGGDEEEEGRDLVGRGTRRQDLLDKDLVGLGETVGCGRGGRGGARG
jgi:hypothetical protein